jgi:hypothetical protein
VWILQWHLIFWPLTHIALPRHITLFFGQTWLLPL